MDSGLIDRLEAAAEAPAADLPAAGGVVSGETLWTNGRRIAMVSLPRGIHVPAHTRDYVEMIYQCSGAGVHRVSGSSFTLRSGEILLLGQNSLHEISPMARGNVALSFAIRPEALADVLNFLGSEQSPIREFVLKCMGPEGPYGYLHFRVGGVRQVDNLVENLVLHLLDYPDSHRKIPVFTLGLLMVQLLEETDRLTIGIREQQAVLRTLQYIETNYATGSLNHVAQQLHYDVTWLSREIKRRTGRTYTELVQERRMNQAAWLLRNTRQKVSDIAVTVGYENVSYFHRLFAKCYGCSPKRYRDQT